MTKLLESTHSDGIPNWTTKQKIEAYDILKRVNGVINLAEEWSGEQVMPESSICMGALRDIRRIIREP